MAVELMETEKAGKLKAAQQRFVLATEFVTASSVESVVVAPGLELIVNTLNRTANKEFRRPLYPNRSAKPEIVVLHETATIGTSADALNRRHLSRAIGTSWNYIIERNGRVYQYVSEEYAAWHAGYSEIFTGPRKGWLSGQIRYGSIGIERIGPNNGTPITSEQELSTVKLLRYLQQRFDISMTPGEDLFEHADIAVYEGSHRRGRKSDTKGEQLNYIAALVHAAPEQGELRNGDWYVALPTNVNALVRQAPNQKATIALKLPGGTKIDIDAWVDGQQIEEDKKWAHTRIGWGFMHHSVLRPTPEPRGVRQAFSLLEDHMQSAVFATIPFTHRRLEYVDCGGYGSDEGLILVESSSSKR